MLHNMKVPSAKALLSAAASAAATTVLIRSIARDFVPRKIRNFFRRKLYSLFSCVSSQITITIDEFEGLHQNQLFQAAELYLGTKISPSARRFRGSIPANETKIMLSMDWGQEVVDVFDGVQFRWKKIKSQSESKPRYSEDGHRSTIKIDSLCFELSFHKKHRDVVLNSYFRHIVSEFGRIKQEKKTLNIHTLRHRGGNTWASVNLDHPATFETMAMDPEIKKMIMEDLDMFVRSKDFYRRVGKAWKRGYLLFGPPGTGKSSLIAAMANYLKFDVYDLELTDLMYNSDLRKLLITTANKSILVVEDIDCSVDLKGRKKHMGDDHPHVQQAKENGTQITLSGFLNFIDGLWSSCGDERIIIFTTNHKEHLDPALLRPGRMDVHIHMSYCTPCGFKMLASNYLRINEHPLFKEVEQLIPTAKVTPAEVGEQLLKTEDPETALEGLVEFLKMKMEENDLKASSLQKESEKRETVNGDI